jgi:hypothetical protein
MVIAGKIRGNAPQLADYLLAEGTNERITILDVDGGTQPNGEQLRDILYSMELNSELTRTRNSVYHAYINPSPDDTTDRAMTMEEWQQSVEILTKQLGYEDQRRVVVLHEKPGKRIHAHIVYERYNHERGVMATYEQNYKAHDRARAEMEKKLSHKPTPQKNKNRDRHKQTLTEIWQRTNTAAQFIREAEANGYKIAKGTDRPFRVVDADGRSFDLVRLLDKVKTQDVRARLEQIKLPSNKQAINRMALLKKEKENAKAIVTQDNQTPLKSNNMNWNDLMSENRLSLLEIRAKHEGKLELLKEMAEEAEKDLNSKERDKHWDKTNQQKEKLEASFDTEMDRQLEAIYNYDQKNKEFPENASSITYAPEVKTGIQARLAEQIEDISDQSAKLERERLLEEMRKAAERNRHLGFERS